MCVKRNTDTKSWKRDWESGQTIEEDWKKMDGILCVRVCVCVGSMRALHSHVKYLNA